MVTVHMKFNGRHPDCQQHTPGEPHRPCWTITSEPLTPAPDGSPQSGASNEPAEHIEPMRPRECPKCAAPITNDGHSVVEISGNWYLTCREPEPAEGVHNVLDIVGRPMPTSIDVFRELAKAMTPEQFREAMSGICKECGGPSTCSCWNDE